MQAKFDMKAIVRAFAIPGDFRGAAPYGSGHINDTYAAVLDQSGAPIRYILQRINHKIFRQPENLMENIQRVTDHLGAKVAALPDASRRRLTLVPTREGRSFHRDGEGNYWRAYLFIEKALTYDAITSPEQAYQAARAFGLFQKQLADMPAPRLHETIPNFHNTPSRFAAFEQALAADSVNRAKLAADEIAFAMSHKPMASALTDRQEKGLLPERITHNDTKLNNVMLDDATGEGVCVIDLDTVMPGLALYDFGDMVRTSTSPAAEDERNLSLVRMQPAMFEALTRGYIASAGDMLTPEEKRCLVLSGKLITFEIGIRFLTDFLAGDTYFKVHRDGHNLDRCRTQFALVRSIESQEEAMQRLVDRL